MKGREEEKPVTEPQLIDDHQQEKTKTTEEKEGKLVTNNQPTEQPERDIETNELKATKEIEGEEGEVEEEEDEQLKNIVEERAAERQMKSQENSDHQYSTGDYNHQANESTDEQSQREPQDDEEEEEVDEEEEEEERVHRGVDSHYSLSPNTQGSEAEVSTMEEKVSTPMTEEEEYEEHEEREEEEADREEEVGSRAVLEDEEDQDSSKASLTTVVIEVRSEEDDDEEEEEGEEQDRVSESSGITDDSENWDMTRGNLVLLEQAIALKAEEVKEGQEARSSPDYQPYSSSSKSSESAAPSRRTTHYGKGTLTFPFTFPIYFLQS